MATVHVTTFQDFVTASAVAGDTVVCPDGAVWDMNEIDPLNTVTAITVRANVTGNNTAIQHYRGRVDCNGGITLNALHLLDCLYDGTRFLGNDGTTASSVLYAENCRFSCSIGTASRYFSDNVRFLRCAMTIDAAAANNLRIFGLTYDRSRYCKIKINAPNAVRPGDTANWKFDDSEFIVDAPLAVYMNGSCGRCTFRGEMPHVSSTDTVFSSNFSVIVAPEYTTTTGNFKAVTDAQLRDANYLASIGFVIGV